jgi:hypothetical protein
MHGHSPKLRGAPADLPFILDERSFRFAKNFTLTIDLGDIDLLGDVPGVDSFESLLSRSVVMDLGGFEVRVASLDDLIAMKKAAGRIKDQIHIIELQALKKLIDNP